MIGPVDLLVCPITEPLETWETCENSTLSEDIFSKSLDDGMAKAACMWSSSVSAKVGFFPMLGISGHQLVSLWLPFLLGEVGGFHVPRLDT